MITRFDLEDPSGLAETYQNWLLGYLPEDTKMRSLSILHPYRQVTFEANGEIVEIDTHVIRRQAHEVFMTRKVRNVQNRGILFSTLRKVADTLRVIRDQNSINVTILPLEFNVFEDGICPKAGAMGDFDAITAKTIMGMILDEGLKITGTIDRISWEGREAMQVLLPSKIPVDYLRICDEYLQSIQDQGMIMVNPMEFI